MNGKIKTKFAALFAVALMITVCVVPVVDNAGVDAAPVSSSNGEVFEGYDITLYKEGGDYSGLVYHGTLPAGFSENDWTYSGDANDNPKNGYWYNKVTKKYLLAEDIPGLPVDPLVYGFPMIQLVYGYDGADVNPIYVTFGVEQNDVPVEIKGTNVTEGKIQFPQSNPNKVQGIITVALGSDVTGHDYANTINLPVAAQVGDFEVVVEAKQGVTQQVINKTINAGAATTVSGKVTDKNGSNVIEGVTIAYEVGETSGSVKTNKDGIYSFNVIPGKTAKITSIAAATSGIGTIYTFDEYSFDFGTINSSKQVDFKAKENTVKVSILDADGKKVESDSGITVQAQWYKQIDSGADASAEGNKYSITTEGNAVTATVKDGTAYIPFVEPTKASGATYYCVISAYDGTYYSFDRATINSSDSSLIVQITNKKGNADATTSSSVSVYAKEKTGTISLYDKGSNPAYGANADVTLYKETTTPAQGATPASYTITAVSGVKGMIDTVVGKTYFTYVIPTAGTNEKYYLLAVGEDVSNKYTFGDIPSPWGTTTSLPTQISGKGIGDATNGSASINATEVTYKISGKVADVNPDAPGIISYSLNGSSNTVSIEKDGTYGFYVKEKSVVTVNAPSGYAPASYILGTIVENEVCDFKKAPATVGSADVEYWITVSGSADKVTFKYSINGESSVTERDIDSGMSVLELTAPFGSIITVSAEIEGYEISEFDGYKASAVKMMTEYVQIQEKDGEPVSGATFKALYKYDKKEFSIDLTADDKGFANFTIPFGSDEIRIAKGTQVETFSNLSEETNYDTGVTYKIVELEAYNAKISKVTINYASVYNSDTVLAEPVAGAKIAPGAELDANVGESIALKAPSIDNFEFVAWMVDGVVVSEKADYTFVVPEHDHDAGEACEVFALYSAVHYEEPAEGLSMNVLVIGIVILILGILAVAYGIISKKQ